MSCTENESGPFVVFFLPAVVGCLTILLARRWANSQVNNTSSTAISRRRKIIKDPLIKRPLPPVACKMVHPGAKKTPGMNNKKCTFPLEDEANGGKRLGRQTRPTSTSAPSVPLSDIKLAEGPVPPKHIPFPHIPQDSPLLFETLMFMFTVVATGLQFLNLYRTAWWLPNSYTNQAMNFYLIDPHLVAFIITLLFRRLLLCLSLVVLRMMLPPKLMPQAVAAARMFILGVILGALAWCTYFIILKYPLVKIFYLCYPAVIYVLLFGFQSAPFLELNNSETPPLHCCTHDPEQVRAEVEVLRQDFNMRVKKILFNAVTGAYYSSFIPCCFAQPYLYYEVYSASQQIVFVLGGLFGRYVSQLLGSAFCDVPHRSALHLGRWEVVANPDPTSDVPEWSGDKLWSYGARVRRGGLQYSATTSTVAAVPGCSEHIRFHSVFMNPPKLLCLLLSLKLTLIVLQLCLLFSSIPWHNFMSIVILLFINYYSLFKMVRDYLVAWKVYRAENLIQDKTSPMAVPNQ